MVAALPAWFTSAPIQLPLGVNLTLASNCVVVLLSLYLILGYLNVIMKGGVGKNGSTVAVRHLVYAL